MKHKHLFFLLAILTFAGLAFAQNQAVDIPGSQGNYISIGPNSAYNLTGPFSVEAWIKKDTVCPTGTFPRGIVSKYWSTDTYTDMRSYRLIEVPDGYMMFQFTTNGTQDNIISVETDVAIPADGNWYHIAGVFDPDNDELRIYINGELNNSSTVAANAAFSANTPVAIGLTFDPDSDRYFDGLIDDVRIWNTARTDEEIEDNYNIPLIGTESGLAGYWKLDGNFNDSSDNEIDGTEVGTLTFTDGNPTLPVELSSFTATLYCDQFCYFALGNSI